MTKEIMKAVVAYGKGEYKYTDVPKPKPVGAEILLEVEACGVCAGDIKCFEGGFRFWGGMGNPAYCEPPFIPGHEFIGRVCGVGESYQGELRLGDRVASEQIVPCGTCRYCREGKYWLCDPHRVYGFKSSLNGGFAEYVILPENAINYKIPNDMPLERAALIEPYACSMHAVDRARITADDVVVIAGAGTLGLGMIAAAARLKPKALISIEPVEALREKALAFGATRAMEAWSEERLEPYISEITEGCGCDVYIEATGHVSAISQGLQLIKKGGRFIEFSVFSAPASIDWSIIGDAKELDLYGVSLSPNCFERSIAGLYDGSLPCNGVVSHTLPLDRFMDAFELAKKRQSIKTVLIP